MSKGLPTIWNSEYLPWFVFVEYCPGTHQHWLLLDVHPQWVLGTLTQETGGFLVKTLCSECPSESLIQSGVPWWVDTTQSYRAEFDVFSSIPSFQYWDWMFSWCPNLHGKSPDIIINAMCGELAIPRISLPGPCWSSPVGTALWASSTLPHYKSPVLGQCPR